MHWSNCLTNVKRRQEFLRRNKVALIVNKSIQNAVLGCNLKNDRMVSVHFQAKPLNITVIQVYAQALMEKHLERRGAKENGPPQQVRSQADVFEQRMLEWIHFDYLCSHPHGKFFHTPRDNRNLGLKCKL